ncbi:hypothetical protein ACJMK2_019461 [Sinanodonta woodiana]|uniref:Uncharacterized protein n=1 Tax=Sinanodonta woodiana TaxID=1069815 RepID=A0ABD3UGI4_SINWO
MASTRTSTTLVPKKVAVGQVPKSGAAEYIKNAHTRAGNGVEMKGFKKTPERQTKIMCTPTFDRLHKGRTTKQNGKQNNDDSAKRPEDTSCVSPAKQNLKQNKEILNLNKTTALKPCAGAQTGRNEETGNISFDDKSNISVRSRSSTPSSGSSVSAVKLNITTGVPKHGTEQNSKCSFRESAAANDADSSVKSKTSIHQSTKRHHNSRAMSDKSGAPQGIAIPDNISSHTTKVSLPLVKYAVPKRTTIEKPQNGGSKSNIPKTNQNGTSKLSTSVRAKSEKTTPVSNTDIVRRSSSITSDSTGTCIKSRSNSKEEILIKRSTSKEAKETETSVISQLQYRNAADSNSANKLKIEEMYASQSTIGYAEESGTVNKDGVNIDGGDVNSSVLEVANNTDCDDNVTNRITNHAPNKSNNTLHLRAEHSGKKVVNVSKRSKTFIKEKSLESLNSKYADENGKSVIKCAKMPPSKKAVTNARKKRVTPSASTAGSRKMSPSPSVITESVIVKQSHESVTVTKGQSKDSTMRLCATNSNPEPISNNSGSKLLQTHENSTRASQQDDSVNDTNNDSTQTKLMKQKLKIKTDAPGNKRNMDQKQSHIPTASISNRRYTQPKLPIKRTTKFNIPATEPDKRLNASLKTSGDKTVCESSDVINYANKKHLKLSESPARYVAPKCKGIGKELTSQAFYLPNSSEVSEENFESRKYEENSYVICTMNETEPNSVLNSLDSKSNSEEFEEKIKHEENGFNICSKLMRESARNSVLENEDIISDHTRKSAFFVSLNDEMIKAPFVNLSCDSYPSDISYENHCCPVKVNDGNYITKSPEFVIDICGDRGYSETYVRTNSSTDCARLQPHNSEIRDENKACSLDIVKGSDSDYSQNETEALENVSCLKAGTEIECKIQREMRDNKDFIQGNECVFRDNYIIFADHHSNLAVESVASQNKDVSSESTVSCVGEILYSLNDRMKNAEECSGAINICESACAALKSEVHLNLLRPVTTFVQGTEYNAYADPILIHFDSKLESGLKKYNLPHASSDSDLSYHDNADLNEKLTERQKGTDLLSESVQVQQGFGAQDKLLCLADKFDTGSDKTTKSLKRINTSSSDETLVQAEENAFQKVEQVNKSEFENNMEEHLSCSKLESERGELKQKSVNVCKPNTEEICQPIPNLLKTIGGIRAVVSDTTTSVSGLNSQTDTEVGVQTISVRKLNSDFFPNIISAEVEESTNTVRNITPNNVKSEGEWSFGELLQVDEKDKKGYEFATTNCLTQECVYWDHVMESENKGAVKCEHKDSTVKDAGPGLALQELPVLTKGVKCQSREAGQDQVPGLSRVNIITHQNSCNRVFLENSSQPNQLMPGEKIACTDNLLTSEISPHSFSLGLCRHNTASNDHETFFTDKSKKQTNWSTCNSVADIASVSSCNLRIENGSVIQENTSHEKESPIISDASPDILEEEDYKNYDATTDSDTQTYDNDSAANSSVNGDKVKWSYEYPLEAKDTITELSFQDGSQFFKDISGSLESFDDISDKFVDAEESLEFYSNDPSNTENDYSQNTDQFMYINRETSVSFESFADAIDGFIDDEAGDEFGNCTLTRNNLSNSNHIDKERSDIKSCIQLEQVNTEPESLEAGSEACYSNMDPFLARTLHSGSYQAIQNSKQTETYESRSTAVYQDKTYRDNSQLSDSEGSKFINSGVLRSIDSSHDSCRGVSKTAIVLNLQDSACWSPGKNTREKSRKSQEISIENSAGQEQFINVSRVVSRAVHVREVKIVTQCSAAISRQNISVSSDIHVMDKPEKSSICTSEHEISGKQWSHSSVESIQLQDSIKERKAMTNHSVLCENKLSFPDEIYKGTDLCGDQVISHEPSYEQFECSKAQLTISKEDILCKYSTLHQQSPSRESENHCLATTIHGQQDFKIPMIELKEGRLIRSEILSSSTDKDDTSIQSLDGTGYCQQFKSSVSENKDFDITSHKGEEYSAIVSPVVRVSDKDRSLIHHHNLTNSIKETTQYLHTDESFGGRNNFMEKNLNSNIYTEEAKSSEYQDRGSDGEIKNTELDSSNIDTHNESSSGRMQIVSKGEIRMVENIRAPNNSKLHGSVTEDKPDESDMSTITTFHSPEEECQGHSGTGEEEEKLPTIQERIAKICDASRTADHSKAVERNGQGRERFNRRSSRRATSTICMRHEPAIGDENNENDGIEAHLRTKSSIRKSSSFRVERNKSNTDENSENSDFDGESLSPNRKVSDICKTFIRKTSSVVIEDKVNGNRNQSPDNQKKLKWVNQNGRWQRVLVDDEDVEQRLTKSATDESLSTELNTPIRKSATSDDFQNADLSCLDFNKATHQMEDSTDHNPSLNKTTVVFRHIRDNKEKHQEDTMILDYPNNLKSKQSDRKTDKQNRNNDISSKPDDKGVDVTNAIRDKPNIASGLETDCTEQNTRVRIDNEIRDVVDSRYIHIADDHHPSSEKDVTMHALSLIKITNTNDNTTNSAVNVLHDDDIPYVDDVLVADFDKCTNSETILRTIIMVEDKFEKGHPYETGTSSNEGMTSEKDRMESKTTIYKLDKEGTEKNKFLSSFATVDKFDSTDKQLHANGQQGDAAIIHRLVSKETSELVNNSVPERNFSSDIVSADKRGYKDLTCTPTDSSSQAKYTLSSDKQPLFKCKSIFETDKSTSPAFKESRTIEDGSCANNKTGTEETRHVPTPLRYPTFLRHPLDRISEFDIKFRRVIQTDTSAEIGAKNDIPSKEALFEVTKGNKYNHEERGVTNRVKSDNNTVSCSESRTTKKSVPQELSITRFSDGMNLAETKLSTESTTEDVPMQIPKLKAVKIEEEEIFEGNPEYTKECNILSLLHDSTSCEKSEFDNKITSKRKELKKQRIPASIEDCANMAKDVFQEELPNVTFFVSEDDISDTTVQNHSTSHQSHDVSLSDESQRLSNSLPKLSAISEPATGAQNVENNGASRYQGRKHTSEGDIRKLMLVKQPRSPTITSGRFPTGDSAKRHRDSDSKLDGSIPGLHNNNARCTGTSLGILHDLDAIPESTVYQQAPVTPLLTEISELEENGDTDRLRETALAEDERGQNIASCGTHIQEQPRRLRSRSKRRSLSLPTGTLSFGEARIVYRNGHFTIEIPGSEVQTNSEENIEQIYEEDGRTSKTSLDDEKYQSSETMEVDFSRPSMRRQYALTTLPNVRRQNEDEDGVFEDEVITVREIPLSPRRQFSPEDQQSFDQYSPEDQQSFDQYSPQDQQSSMMGYMENGYYSLPRNIGRNRHMEDFDSQMEQDFDRSFDSNQSQDSEIFDSVEEKHGFQSMNKSSCSLPVSVKQDKGSKTILRPRRTSSFKQATEKGSIRLSSIAEDSQHKSRRRAGSLDESNNINSFPARSSAGNFLQRMVFRRKSSAERPGGKSVSFSKQNDAAKEFFAKKLTLKTFFKRNKSELTATSPIKSISRPTSPPLAVFNSDEDIHSIESAPCSPSTSDRSFRQRYTSGDVDSAVQSFSRVHFQQSVSNVDSTSKMEEDQISIQSSTSSNMSSLSSPITEQPQKPKTPKPVGSSPKRNFTGHPLRAISQTDSVSLVDNENMENSNREITPTNGHSINFDRPLSARDLIACATNLTEPKISTGRINYDKLMIAAQADITASNSNDSGIQNDVSVHSSNESFRGTPEGQVTMRQKKSPSPKSERPKSEIHVGVRWADQGEATPTPSDPSIRPIRWHERDHRHIPRPTSDLDGSSLMSDKLKAFGSETDLHAYCSLRDLYEARLKPRDTENSKLAKNRRMSTPHPIKARLEKAPKKVDKKKHPMVARSNSMPESLDKIHKRRRLTHLLDFHMDTFANHADIDDSSSLGSDFSLDHISLQDKTHSVQSSHSQLTTTDEEEDNLTYAEALWDHITMDPEELAFRAGDVINVTDLSDKDWWFGLMDGQDGWFPATFVRLRANQDQVEDEEEDIDLDVTLRPGHSSSPKLRRISTINKNQARTNVVNEIINAEREYVKHLKDVVEGYIRHAKKRIEMFPPERVKLIFGNIEEIYAFSSKFLEELEMCFDPGWTHLSQIGNCFLNHRKGFEIYSDYCNNHPAACEELKELYRNKKYKHFFEACRLLQELVEIPLEGFLLTPVQKICKYPLQLAELLKYTPPEHHDREPVENALLAMKAIATLINERKRKMESIEKIAAWQQNVVDWGGPDLLEKSSELIYSGELFKINSAGWSQERYFFLFDHQLIYCRKELLKRHVFCYKGRIQLDHSRIMPIPDGRDPQYNVTVKNAWKIYEVNRDKWYLLYSKTPALKERWLKALQDERLQVIEDQKNGFCVPDHWKQTILNKIKSQSKDKQGTSRSANPMPLLLHKDILKDYPADATLPRNIHRQKQQKKKAWSLFGGKKSKT